MKRSHRKTDLFARDVQIEMNFTPRRVTVFRLSPAEYRAVAKCLRFHDASQWHEDLARDHDQLATVAERMVRKGRARIMEKVIRLPTRDRSEPA